MRRDDVYDCVLRNTAPVPWDDIGSRLRILFEKVTWSTGTAGIDRICRRGHGGSVYLESPDSSYGTGGGYGQRCGDPCRSRFLAWILFLLILDRLIPHLHRNADQPEGVKSGFGRTTMLLLAVTLHNIPEGMAVGVVYAGFLTGNDEITAAGALALSLGIAIQNFPEGAIISMPLRAEGMKKGQAFLSGVLSGIVEPLGAVLTILAAQFVVPALPYLLSFAAGAMLYVVVEELIPEMSAGKHSNIGTVFFALGFSVMMVLDVVLG